MKSPLNLLDGLASLVRSRGDDTRAATVDATGQKAVGSAAKEVSPAQAKQFDTLLAEAVENEASSTAGGRAVPGPVAKTVAGSITKAPLPTSGNPAIEQGAAQVVSTTALDAPATKSGRSAQPGLEHVQPVAVAVPGNADSRAEEVPLKTTPRAPPRDLSREAQNVLPSGPGSFHSTISHAAKQAARDVPTGTMAAPPQGELLLDAERPASTAEQAPLDAADTERRDHDDELAVDDAAPIEEPRAPSGPLAAVLESVAALVSRIVAPAPATAAGAASASAQTESTATKVEPAHGELAQREDTFYARADDASTPADAQAFRELTTAARAANHNGADAPRVDPSEAARGTATTAGEQGASLGSKAPPLVDAKTTNQAPVVRVEARAQPATADATLQAPVGQGTRGGHESAVRAAPALPQQGAVTLSAAEQTAVSRAAASMVQSAATPAQPVVGAAPGSSPSGAVASAAGAVSPAVASASTKTPLTTAGSATARVVVTADGAGDTRPLKTTGVERPPAPGAPPVVAMPAPAASPTASPTVLGATPVAPGAAPAAATEGLRPTAQREPAQAASPAGATPVAAATPSPAVAPVLVQQGALAEQGAIASASAANRESASGKVEPAGESSSDGPIAPLRGFSRGAFVGHALSAYGGRGHESTDQQSTRGRFSDEREVRPEATRATEANAAADLSALAQVAQPTPEAPPAPIASPQPAAPLAPPQPIVDVPNVEFAARPPASQNENASVSLHHPDLGPIRLDVQRTAGRIEVHAVIESVHAEAVLRANESGIRQSVQQSGMTFSALRVRVRGEETNPLRQAQVRRRRANERET